MVRLMQFISLFLALFTATAFSPAAPSRRISVWGRSTFLQAAVIEKEVPLKTPGPAVLEPETDTESPKTRNDRSQRRQRQGNEAWEVRIYNDGLNTREHVARSLVQITGMSEINAYQTMMQAHQNGLAVVGRYVYEIAEMYHDALRKQGIVTDLVPVDEEF
jgi:ATP-dependent Clp protease adapter protein ClpS